MGIETGQQLLHYRIVERIGEGGMGVVWKALDTNLNRPVAIKILPEALAGDAERLARFEREARTLASLQHANVASVYGFERAGEHRFLVMELAEGEDLVTRIERGALPLDDVVHIARQIALGLEAAHQKGLVHRDLKPANIKLGADGQVKILDFGLARAVEPDAQGTEHSPTITSAMTQAGVVMGTPAYMSPEQARGKPVDARTDIWAFGCVLYEMLVGEAVYRGDTVSDVIARVLEREPELDKLPAATPPNLRRLLRRCFSKDPGDRLHHIADARIELGDLESPEPLPAAVPQEQPRARSRGMLWLSWAVSAALALALGLSLVGEQPAKQVTRFAIEPPLGTELREFELSPDGTALAFVIVEKRGNTQLWLRNLDATEAEPLPNTAGVSLPFWSPDGRALGYFQDGKLRRMDLATRTSQTLADAPNGRGAAWSEDDVILFTPEGLDVLYSVPASGGPVTQVTRLHVDDTFPEEATHRFPHFLPGGEHFIYVTQDPTAKIGSSRSFLTSMSDPDDRRPIVMGLTEVYAPPGYLLFVREKTLIAQPFDRGRLELGGTGHALATDIANAYPRTGSTSFSVSSTGVLAYRSIEAPRTELAWYDRSGSRLESITESAGTYIAPGLSPDGRHFAYLRLEGDIGELWVRDLDRNTNSRLASTEGGIRVNSPRFENDDALIYILDGDLYRVYVDRNDPPEVVWKRSGTEGEDEPTVVMHADYGDGSLMILQNWDSETDWDLWTFRPDVDPAPRVLVREGNSQQNPALSPDGKWVAYESDESGRFEVYVQSVDDVGGKRVVSSNGGQTPRWSPDGSEIYYVSPDFDLMVVPWQSRGRATSGTATRLFQAPAGAADLFWNTSAAPQLVSARGDRFLFNEAVDAAAAQRIQVVLNWDAELQRE